MTIGFLRNYIRAAAAAGLVLAGPVSGPGAVAPVLISGVNPMTVTLAPAATTGNAEPAESGPLQSTLTVRTFPVIGIVEEVRPREAILLVKHEAIPNYMGAMTMPFKAKDTNELSAIERGDQITFQLCVTADQSWVQGIKKIGVVPLPAASIPPTPKPEPVPLHSHPLLAFKFTNELSQPVSLGDFHGQALAITFFYSRCPLPDYCPRLSRNFAEAEQKLEAMTNAPANWHFLSVSFDPQFDTPALLKSYGQSYHYDSAHWSFLTGPEAKIGELARACGVRYQPEAGIINHNFRTLIINAAGHLQMVFPTSGDLSDPIVAQMLQAAAAP